MFVRRNVNKLWLLTRQNCCLTRGEGNEWRLNKTIRKPSKPSRLLYGISSTRILGFLLSEIGNCDLSPKYWFVSQNFNSLTFNNDALIVISFFKKLNYKTIKCFQKYKVFNKRILLKYNKHTFITINYWEKLTNSFAQVFRFPRWLWNVLFSFSTFLTSFFSFGDVFYKCLPLLKWNVDTWRHYKYL